MVASIQLPTNAPQYDGPRLHTNQKLFKQSFASLVTIPIDLNPDQLLSGHIEDTELSANFPVDVWVVVYNATQV